MDEAMYESKPSAATVARAVERQVVTGVPGPSAPRLHRGSMVARPWRGFTRSLVDAAWSLVRSLSGKSPAAGAAGEPSAWVRAAARRRRTLVALILASATLSTFVLARSLPAHADPLLRTIQVALFGVLFAWVAAGFFTALMGFWVMLRGDPHALSARSVGDGPIDAGARTAIVMPICNEETASVFAGLRAIWESLEATGQAPLFDLFILSDTSNADTRAAELSAWARLRLQFAGREPARIYYRWRQRRAKRKSGNVADFCRRWGRDYRYMVVLDADSVMSGAALVTMVRLMEADPRAGIVQTMPQTCGLNTVHARSQQFAARVAGRLFGAGMQFWQLGESHYWGHNAIIRVAAFMEHCALAPLRGRGGLSGEIMSHDFVEAALIRRAGYHVWVVQDLAGSYEQQPPNLLEELQRDRRWCQGNLQNARLVAEPGLHGVHRAMLVTGAMAYLSAPLWLCYVLLSVGLWLFGGLFGGALPGAVAAGVPVLAAMLWMTTAAMLLLPRMLGVLAIRLRGEQSLYGGTRALITGTALEAALSVLQAPVRMVAHTIFVVVALTGLTIGWKSPPREAQDVAWLDAARRFWPVTLAVALLAGWTLAVQPHALLWLAPVGLPLLLAAPLAVWTSRSSLGARLRENGLLVTPEELHTPAVLGRAWTLARRPVPAPRWQDAIQDPWLSAVARAAVGTRDTGWGARGRARRSLLRGLNSVQDTLRLSPADRLRILVEPQSIVRLRDQLAADTRDLPHRNAWGLSAQLPAPQAARRAA
jgi:membrane glycosyltransferase